MTFNGLDHHQVRVWAEWLTSKGIFCRRSFKFLIKPPATKSKIVYKGRYFVITEIGTPRRKRRLIFIKKLDKDSIREGLKVFLGLNGGDDSNLLDFWIGDIRGEPVEGWMGTKIKSKQHHPPVTVFRTKRKEKHERKPKIVVSIPDEAFKGKVNAYLLAKFGTTHKVRSYWIIGLIRKAMESDQTFA